MGRNFVKHLVLAMALLSQLCIAQNHWDAFLNGMLMGTKKTMMPETAEKMAILMNDAAVKEIDWQIYHNWQLRLPEESKDKIYFTTF